jgi:hypothetical protein
MKKPIRCTEGCTAEDSLCACLQSRPGAQPAGSTSSITVGRLAVIVAGSAPLVDFPDNQSGRLLPSRTVVSLQSSDVGREVALGFEDGDSERPIILGVLQDFSSLQAAMPDQQQPGETQPRQVLPETLCLSAAREMTLQCGKASITLTAAGKLLLRGAYLLSRSSGVNRIKGGSVQIN